MFPSKQIYYHITVNTIYLSIKTMTENKPILIHLIMYIKSTSKPARTNHK